MTKSNKFVWVILLLLLLHGVLGCSNSIKVSGKVTFDDGMPLEIGKVVFEDDKHTYSSQIQKDGTFSMGQLKDGQGIPVGKYRVYIAEAIIEEFTPDSPFPKVTELVAAKYRNSQTSGFEYDIQKKTTDISLVVEKP
ncbi:MAG: hypothetical protein LBQ66_00245 [Planctomycetaceae bacterium]|jgi:hypothetical protein|nr:hypothetical protein [Planctomycetaceae bacterium]